MTRPVQVLLVAQSKQTLEMLKPLLRDEADIKFSARVVEQGQADPLQGVKQQPDILLLELSDNWEHELSALKARVNRPEVLALSTRDDPAMMRMAMQAGARDFFTTPLVAHELSAALHKAAQEKLSGKAPYQEHMTAVLNAKGGSGATLLASNLAHILAADMRARVALVDLDLHFGTAALYLDLHPETGILEALADVDELDAVALQGYMTKHPSGLEVLAASSDQIVLPLEASATQLNRLLEIVAQNYDHVLVDLPRVIDSRAAAVLERADQIVLVVQQFLSHLHDAKRIIHFLRHRIDRTDDQILTVVNRYNSKSSVTRRNIEQALQNRSIGMIPNDYKRVSQAEHLGIPLRQHAPSAPITKAIARLARHISGKPEEKRGLFKRMFRNGQHALSST